MKKYCVALGAVVSMLTALSAAGEERPITLNLGMSQWNFDGERDLSNISAPMIGLEWAFDDNWATELSYTRDDANDKLFASSDAEVTLLNLGLLYYGGSYIGKPNRVRPYAAFGVGALNLGPSNSAHNLNDDYTMNAGVGLRWMITERFGARADVRVVYGMDENTSDTVLTAGLNYYFGAVSKTVPVVAAVAQPVDTDGDGVVDDMDRCPNTEQGRSVDATGCPLPVTRVASIELDVNFANDAAVVEAKYLPDLANLAEFMSRFPEVNATIEGHTDATGPAAYNQKLSLRRAQAVVDVLINKYGIAPGRLTARGYGESQPVASNETAEGRARNRRVIASLKAEYQE